MAQDYDPTSRIYKARSGLFHMLADLASDEGKFDQWKSDPRIRDDIMEDYGLDDRQKHLLRLGWKGDAEPFLMAIKDETILRFNKEGEVNICFC